MLTETARLICRHTAAAIVLAAASGAYAGAPGDPLAQLAGFHAEYKASYIGFSAEATVDLRATGNPDEYEYEVVTRARGLARLIRPGTGRETSLFMFDESGFSPIRYQLDDGTEKVENDTDIKFDWDAGVAYSVYKDEPKEIAIAAGMLDRLSADIAAIHALRDEQKPASYEIVDRNSVRVYEFTLQGEETVSVPAGEFRAVKYLRQRPGSSRATLIWYAPDVDFLPVKIQQLKRGKSNIVMVATSLKPAEPCADCDSL